MMKDEDEVTKRLKKLQEAWIQKLSSSAEAKEAAIPPVAGRERVEERESAGEGSATAVKAQVLWNSTSEAIAPAPSPVEPAAAALLSEDEMQQLTLQVLAASFDGLKVVLESLQKEIKVLTREIKKLRTVLKR